MTKLTQDEAEEINGLYAEAAQLAELHSKVMVVIEWAVANGVDSNSLLDAAADISVSREYAMEKAGKLDPYERVAE